MFTESFIFKNKKTKKKTKAKQKPIVDQNMDKPPKKPRGMLFNFMIFGTIFFLFIAGIKVYKIVVKEMSQEITVEQQENFADKLQAEASNKIATSQNEQSRVQNITSEDDKKKAEEEQEKAKKEEYLQNQQRLITGYLLGQDVSVLFENDSTKLIVSGAGLKIGDIVYDNFKISDIRIDRSTGENFDDATIIFEFSKDNEIIKDIKIKIVDSYSLEYYYEGVVAEPRSNPALRTKMIFPNNDIKPNFKFKSFSEDGTTAEFIFTIFKQDFKKILPLDQLR